MLDHSELKEITELKSSFSLQHRRGGYLAEVIEAERALWTLSLSAVFSCFCKRSDNYVTCGLLAFVPFMLTMTILISFWLPSFIAVGRVLIPITERAESLPSGRASSRAGSLLQSSSSGRSSPSTASPPNFDMMNAQEKSYWRRRRFYQQMYSTRRTYMGLKRHNSMQSLKFDKDQKLFHEMVRKKLETV